jgi:hypothetical protein
MALTAADLADDETWLAALAELNQPADPHQRKPST